MRIILFSSGFNNYDSSIKKYLEKKGHKVFHYSYRSNIYSNNFLIRLRHKIYSKINIKYESDYWNGQLKDLCKESSPDIVFIVKGEILYPDTLDWVRANTRAKIVCWLMDVIKLYPRIEALLNYYDYIFTFEPDDIDYLKQFNRNTFHLPLAYDPDNFYNMENIEKKWDMTFVGSWRKSREKFLIKISKLIAKENINVLFLMNYYSLFNPLTCGKWFKRNTVYRYFRNHDYLSLSEINLLFNQSKVCLNIHDTITNNALNIRTFEILGSGGVQLIENFETAKTLFSNYSSIIKYNSPEDLVKKLKKVLLINKNKNYLSSEHTFEHRLNQMFNMIDGIDY